MKQEFEISGMSCGHCVKAVRSALDGVDEVSVVEVSIGGATVELKAGAGADADSVRRAVTSAIEDEGYAVVTSRTVSTVDEA